MINPFLRAYEFEKRYGLDRLKLTLEKAEQAYKTHGPETIDFCKSALECICKSILSEKGDSQHTGIQDVPKLIKSTLRALGHPSEQIGSGISSLAHGIAELRNENTIAGHGDPFTPIATKTRINLFVKTFSHIVDVILTLLDAQDIDLLTTKMTFEAVETELSLADINEEIDTSVTVEYIPEDGVIFIEGKEVRPSKLLFHYDRAGYSLRIEKAKDEHLTHLKERFHEQITETLYERFENFHPGHYGVDDLEIIFDQVEVGDKVAKVTGNISASARLGSSSAEGGMDVDYASGFQASFNSNDTPDTFELEKLELDVVDWIQPDDIELFG